MNKLEKPPLKCRELEQHDGKQNRWLTVPGSRIIVNPFCFNLPVDTYPSQYSNRPYMPLNIGCLAPAVSESKIAYSFNDLFMLHANQQLTSELHYGFRADSLNSSCWTKSEFDRPQDCEVSFDREGITVKVKEAAVNYWQYITIVVKVDLDRTPLFQVEVPECLSAWGVTVAPEDAASCTQDIAIIAENSATGVFAADIAKATGWSGSKSFKLRLYAYGIGRSITFSNLGIAGVQNPIVEAKHFVTSWLPYELPFRAEYHEGMVLEGCDLFYDAHTLCRVINVKDMGKAQKLVVGGKFKGSMTFEKNKNMLLVEDGDCFYSQRLFGIDRCELSYYANYCDYISRTNSMKEPPAAGYWQAELSNESIKDNKFFVMTAFQGPGETQEDVIQKMTVELSHIQIEDQRKCNEKLWDDYLEKVPKPSSFSIDCIDPKGVTPELIEKQYYLAWIFLISNVLPKSPETGYNYPQISCGMASLWGHGAPEAPYSASWESFIAMQLYAYIDTETAWEAFKGLMSLVDETGMLAGESLPSRKAQTAAILYSLTKDKQSLLHVYPYIKKYMLWRVDNPRWILGTTNDPNTRDADFAVSALIDILYLKQIASDLGIEEDIALWEEAYRKLYQNYKLWFWEEPGRYPYQYFDIGTGLRQPGNTAWVLSGILLPSLEEQYQKSLMDRFLSEFETDKPFGGLHLPKYPEMSFDIWGLMDKGYKELALQMMDVSIRDVTRANFFSEQYEENIFPYPSGVRPSIFGCALLIDCVLMKNGCNLCYLPFNK